MNKKILIGSILAVVLLTLVSFSSVVGYSSVKSNPSNTIITDEWDFEYCKDYLFETLVEISNNEDVNDLINSNNQNLFPSNSNHRTLFPFRKNTNKLSVEHLDLLYKMGSMIIDRLGEDKVAEIMETRSIDKPEFADELDTIIMNDDELADRIYTLNRMNGEEVSIADFEKTPIICFILGIISLVTLFIYLPSALLLEILESFVPQLPIFMSLPFLFLYLFIFVLFTPISLINEGCSYLYTHIFSCPEFFTK